MQNVTALEWAVLERFTAYVRSLPDGEVDVTEPATWSESGAAVFPFDRVGEDGALLFAGALRLVGHGGMLDIAIGELRLEPGETSFELTIIGDAPDDRFAIAAGEMSGLITSQPVEVRLTEDGCDVFFARYPVGQPLDPIILR